MPYLKVLGFQTTNLGCLWPCMCVHLCANQKTILSVVPQEPSTLAFEIGTRKTGHCQFCETSRPQKSPCFLLLQCWDYNHCFLIVTWILGIKFRQVLVFSRQALYKLRYFLRPCQPF